MTALVNSSGKFSDIYWIKKHTVCTHDTTTNKLGFGYYNKNSLTKKKIANQKRYLIREHFGHFHRKKNQNDFGITFDTVKIRNTFGEMRHSFTFQKT